MNNDLTILPIVPEESELTERRELHPNLPNIYKGQLICLVGGVRMGKSTIWNNMLHNENFYEGLFNGNVSIISPTVWNDSSSRYSAKKFKETCYDKYEDSIIDNIIKVQQEKRKDPDIDTSYAVIIDDSYGEFNRHGRKGGSVLRLASRFRHYVRKGDAALYLYSTQKYLDILPLLRANATSFIVSGMIKNRKELDAIKYDLDDSFGGRFEELMEHARTGPYQWIYFRLDTTPCEAYLNFETQIY